MAAQERRYALKPVVYMRLGLFIDQSIGCGNG